MRYAAIAAIVLVTLVGCGPNALDWDEWRTVSDYETIIEASSRLRGTPDALSSEWLWEPDRVMSLDEFCQLLEDSHAAFGSEWLKAQLPQEYETCEVWLYLHETPLMVPASAIGSAGATAATHVRFAPAFVIVDDRIEYSFNAALATAPLEKVDDQEAISHQLRHKRMGALIDNRGPAPEELSDRQLRAFLGDPERVMSLEEFSALQEDSGRTWVTNWIPAEYEECEAWLYFYENPLETQVCTAWS